MDYKEINLEKIDVIDKKVYHNHRVLEFWTPAMYVPFGLDHYNNNFGEKYDVKLSFRNQQGQFLSTFMNKIKSLDAYFKRVYKDTEYNSLLKYNNLTVKIPYVNENFQCGVQSEHEPLPTVFSIKKGSWVRCLIRVEKVWKYAKRSGCLLVAKQFVLLNKVEDNGDEQNNKEE